MGRSDILSTLFLGKPPRGRLPVLSAHHFAINRQMLFLNQWKRKPYKYFHDQAGDLFLHHFQSDDDDDDIKLLDLSKKGPLNLEGFATCDVNARLAIEDNVSVTRNSLFKICRKSQTKTLEYKGPTTHYHTTTLRYKGLMICQS